MTKACEETLEHQFQKFSKSLNTIFKKEWNLITVSDGVEVNIVVVGREEEEGKPGDKGIPDKTRDWKFEDKKKDQQ